MTEYVHLEPHCVCMLSCFIRVWLFVTSWTVTFQAPLSMGFSRQEYWSGLPCPPPGNLPNPGIEPPSLYLLHQQAGSLPLVLPGKPIQPHAVQFSCSAVSYSVTPWTAACQASLSITNSWSLLKLKLVTPSNQLILCRPLLLLPSNLSQHQGLYQWISASHQVAKVLKFQLQDESFQWIFRTDFLCGLTSLVFLKSKGLSRVFYNTTGQKHQFFSAQLSLWSNSHIHTFLLEKP